MAQVDVSINGRTYQVACDDGQEEHLAQLGEYLDKRVRELVNAVGQVGDARLLVMVSLLVADELAETYAELKQLRAESAGERPKQPAVAARAAQGGDEALEARLAEIVDAAAHRIESIAAELDPPH